MGPPSELKALFWDLDFEALEIQTDRRTIVARIAEYGTDDAVRWMRATYDSSEIAEAIESRRHLLSRPTIELWRVWLNKPEDWCRAIPSRPLKGTFWPS